MFNNNTKLTLCVVLLCLTLSVGSPVEGTNATILVFGRSGSGFSSTVRMLLGNLTPAIETETGYSNSPGNKSVITEYVIPIRGYPPSFLKIVDVDGVTDDKLPEDDAYVQASLKTYLKHPQGLNSQEPTAVLIVSPFDDNRYDDDQSLYVKMLRRIADVERSVYPNSIPDINILIFTRLMTETKQFQRSPSSKLETLKATAIERVKGLSPEISTIVGENKGEEHGLTMNEKGTYKLPNREFYPENVFDAVASLAAKNGRNEDLRIVKNFAQLRLNSDEDSRRVSVSRVPFTIFPDSNDVDYFIRSIVRSGKGEIEDNEVNSALQITYEGLLDANLKTRTADKVPRLQAFFQFSNITKFSDLPSTQLDKVKLFQSLPTAIEHDVIVILKKALNLTMPPFTQSLTVGHGYDVLKDEVLPPSSVPFSPVAFNTWKFSGMGYLLPSFLSCKKLPRTQVQTYMNFADSVTESVLQRQTYLEYSNKGTFNISTFDGQIRLGFNIKPSKGDVAALSAVKEIRTHKMQLNDQIELSEEFEESVKQLSPFKSSVRESEKEWKAFFQKWGTHVVASGFVGGFIQGTLISDDISEAYNDGNRIENALELIVNFTRVGMKDEVMFYGVFGGDKDPKLANVHEVEAGERMQIVENWESSLSYEPVVLNYEMDLIPISFLVGRVNETMGSAAVIALDLLLQGKLTYKRSYTRRASTEADSSTTTLRYMKSTTANPGTTTSGAYSPSFRAEHSTTPKNPSAPVFEQENRADIGFPTVGSKLFDFNVSNENDPQAVVARKIFEWVADNEHRFNVLESFHKNWLIQQRDGRKRLEDASKRFNEEIMKSRRIQQEMEQNLESLKKKYEDDRRRDLAKARQNQLELELEGAKELRELKEKMDKIELSNLDLQRQLNEAAEKNTRENIFGRQIEWVYEKKRTLGNFIKQRLQSARDCFYFAGKKTKEFYYNFSNFGSNFGDF